MNYIKLIGFYLGFGFTIVSLIHLLVSYVDVRPNRNDVDIFKVGRIGLAVMLLWPLYGLVLVLGYFWSRVCNLSRTR